jgi:glycosyltransferase involved in cell wall biosynthesis
MSIVSNGRPRILHIVPAMFGANGVHGGAERYALELARHMAEVVHTRLLTFGEQDRVEKFGELEVRVVGNPWFVRGQRGNPFSSAVFTESSRADIIHCHQQHILSSSLTAAYAQITGRKVFVSDLGGGGWDISSYINTDRWFDGHLHISDYSRKIFGQQDQRWAHVILGGIDVEKFSPDPSVSSDGSIVFVGRLLPHKGVNYLIEAAPPDLPVKIIGRPMDERYFHYLQSLAAGKRVTFHHDFGDDEVIKAYRGALCVVLPSVYKNVYGDETRVPELLGQTLLEGMACGVPGICTNVASMPEIVRDGISGFLVPPNDAVALREKLIWLHNHREETRRMGQAARDRVLEKFTWPRVVQRSLEIYGCR